MSEIKVQIKTPSKEKNLEVSLNSSYTVQQAKESIAKHCDTPAERQRLIFAGRVLKDHQVLSDCSESSLFRASCVYPTHFPPLLPFSLRQKLLMVLLSIWSLCPMPQLLELLLVRPRTQPPVLLRERHPVDNLKANRASLECPTWEVFLVLLVLSDSNNSKPNNNNRAISWSKCNRTLCKTQR